MLSNWITFVLLQIHVSGVRTHDRDESNEQTFSLPSLFLPGHLTTISRAVAGISICYPPTNARHPKVQYSVQRWAKLFSTKWVTGETSPNEVPRNSGVQMWALGSGHWAWPYAASSRRESKPFQLRGPHHPPFVRTNPWSEFLGQDLSWPLRMK